MFFVFLMSFSTQSVFAKSTYQCHRYVNGKPTGGHVKVSADSKDEATTKALAKYKKLGYKVDYVKCK